MEFLVFLFVLGLPFALVLVLGSAVLKTELQQRLSTSFRSMSNSLPGRLGLMAVTGGALLIPLTLVDGLRQERGYRLANVKHEITQQWGTSQNLVGPVIWVPVLDHSEDRVEKTDKDGNVKVHYRPTVVQRGFLVLPQTLEVAGHVVPKALHRGLYDVLVYTAGVEIDATFDRPEFPVRAGHTLEPLWHEAQLIVQLSDLSAVSAVNALEWDGSSLKPESGPVLGQPNQVGIRGVLPGFETDSATVRIDLDLRGTDSLLVGALGESSEVELEGSWDAPSFTGFTLPKERHVDGQAFNATWSVPGVARPVPQLIEISGSDNPLQLLAGHTVGVRLVEPASPYASVERAIEYGMLVIALCLLTFLVLEHGLELKLHPVQWLVNGLALVVFYLVLLATSEHWGFQVAYSAASVLTVGLIATYILISTRAARAGVAVASSLGVLYGSMFAMLRSEDHALLTGTALVVVALTSAMWITRHVGREEAGGHSPFGEPQPAS